MRHSQDITVIGLGYVGLTLSLVMADLGFHVTGVESNPEVLDGLRRLQPHFHENGLRGLLSKVMGKGFDVSAKMPDKPQDAIIVSVGTPLEKGTGRPMLEHLDRAIAQIAPFVHDRCLVVLRSTVPVGTSRRRVLPALREKVPSPLLAFCPERTIEGKALREVRSLPQIIAGVDEESSDRAQDIFQRVTHTTVRVSSLETGETIKLLDNAYRDLTFAFANEVALMSEHFGVNAWEVISSANTGYARNNIPIPGYVGGACLEKDPHILVHCASEHGYVPTLVRDGRNVNEALPEHTVAKLERQLQQTGGPALAQASVLVAGLAFKGRPETDDLRGSPALDIVGALKRRSSKVYGQDFVVRRSVIEGLGVIPYDFGEPLPDVDAIIVANNHPRYESLDLYAKLAGRTRPLLILDDWQVLDPGPLAGLAFVRRGGLGVG
jgi:UDP-N-acetyl-D-mannosaminuronic acid dehydrogenase